MAQKHLQLLRNNTPYSSYTAAYDALKAMTGATYADGTPIIARYNGNNDEIKTLLGIVNKKSGDARVDIINDVQASILRDYNLEDATSGAIATNDSIEVALNKLENQVKAAKAAATTVVKEGVDNPHMAITSSTDSQTSATTYTITLTDVASDTALTEEIAARKAVDGQNGQAYVANTGVNYIGDATSLNNADVKLDTAVASLSGKVDNLNYDLAKDDNKVVVSLNQTNGKISGTSENITSVKLADYTVGGNDSGKIAATDTLGEALGKLQGQINGMDKAASAVDGQVVTTVTEADGKVSETKANVKDLQLGGYVKNASATGAISGTDTVNDALSKLENSVGANKITNDDHSIVVTEPTGAATTTDVKVNIKSGEKVIKLGNDGIYTNLNLVKITDQLPETVKERYELHDSDNNKIGESIDIAKDSHIVSINYITTGEHAQNLEYVYIDVSGNTQTTYVNMSELVLETEFASGVTVTDHVAHGVVDSTSEKDESNAAFLTVGAGGFKVSGIKDAIDTKINKLDVTGDTAAAGQYVAAIQEADGIVSVKTRANVSEAVLNNYAKGSDATAVVATDTVNQAISKLENQVDAAKAAATTKVAKDANASHLTLTSSTAADGSVTYTIGEDDIASKTDLDDEIAARKAVDGQTGQTYTAHTNKKYISGATSLDGADVALNDAIASLDAETIKTITETHTGCTVTVSGTGNTRNIAVDTDGSQIKLTNYTKGSDSGTVASTDTVNQAISKLENQIDAVEGDYLKKVVVNGVTGTVANNVATVTIDGGDIELTGYDGTATGTPAASDSVNNAIAKLYNKTNTYTSSANTIEITTGASSTNFDVILDDSTNASSSTAHAQYASNNYNAIENTGDGLYVSAIWDCGTYN